MVKNMDTEEELDIEAEESEKMYCPLRRGECVNEKCMLYVIVNNGIRLGCAMTVMAKQLDKMEFTLRKKYESDVRVH